MGEVKTYKETDFIWLDGEPQGITHAILYDAVGSHHIPAVVGASLVEDNEPIGFISSKHIFAPPHTYTDAGFRGWAIFRRGNTLIIEIITPAHISKDMGEQKNAWLFNYPPARDIAGMLVDIGVERFVVLTSDIFDRSIDSETTSEECIEIIAEEIGKEETHSSLQTLWGWLPAFMFGVEKKGASILIIPSSENFSKLPKFEKTEIRSALGLLKRWGFDTLGSSKKAKDIYEKASSENAEAMRSASEVIAKMKAKTKKENRGLGGMFQ